MARPCAPDARKTSTSTVGFPRESRTWRPWTCSMLDMDPARLPGVAAVEGVANVTAVRRARKGIEAVRCVVMPVRVGRGAVESILDAAGAFALHVQHPSDLGVAISALKLARV